MLRREFTQLAAGMPLMLSLPLSAKAGASLAWYEDAAALVLADPAQADYSGAGYYLYPAWGKPGLYYVEDNGRGLNFLAPESRKLLWQQPTMAGMFAAAVLQVMPAERKAEMQQAYFPLRVPMLPVT